MRTFRRLTSLHRRPPSIPAVEESLAVRVTVAVAMMWPVAALSWAGGLYLTGFACVAAILVGHVYSWKHKHQPSSKRTFGLFALATLAFLWMIADLTTAFAGGWLPQAQFGMLIQAITSFELRSRTNLYSTLIHSLLIMYVAGDLSFSIGLIFFIIAFGIAISGFLVIGYLEDEKKRSLNSLPLWSVLRLKWTWAGFTLLSFALAAALFLALPRGVTRQVNSPNIPAIALPGGVKGQTVTPLYPFVQLSSGGESGFSPKMDLAFRGRPSNAVVMHVRSPLSSYWRGLAFDKYAGQEWISTSSRTRVIGSAGSEFSIRSGTSTLESTEYAQTFFIKRDQSDAIFTGYQPVRVRIPARQLYLAAGEEGIAQAGAALAAGTTYAVVSSKPILSGDALHRDKAISSERRYLELPQMPGRVANLAQQIVAGAETDYAKALTLEKYLSTTYPYDLNVPPSRPGADAVDRFLFEDKRGFCQQFATAMAVMARAAGLPSRVATGYLPGEYSPMAGGYIVRARDAHSWVEIYFQKHGWVPFDPTPAVGGAPRAGAVNTWWGSHTKGIQISGVGAAAGTLIGSAGILLGLSIVPILSLSAAAALVLLCFRLLRIYKRRTGRNFYLDSERGSIVNTYKQMERWLKKKGVPSRIDGMTPKEYSLQVRARVPTVAEAVEVITEAVNRAVYDPSPLQPSLVSDSRTALARLKKSQT